MTLVYLALVLAGFLLGHASRVRWRARREANTWTLSSVQITQRLARRSKTP